MKVEGEVSVIFCCFLATKLGSKGRALQTLLSIIFEVLEK